MFVLSLVHTLCKCKANFGDATIARRSISLYDAEKLASHKAFAGCVNRAFSLFEVCWTHQECTVRFGQVQTNLPKPSDVIIVLL